MTHSIKKKKMKKNEFKTKVTFESRVKLNYRRLFGWCALNMYKKTTNAYVCTARNMSKHWKRSFDEKRRKLTSRDRDHFNISLIEWLRILFSSSSHFFCSFLTYFFLLLSMKLICTRYAFKQNLHGIRAGGKRFWYANKLFLLDYLHNNNFKTFYIKFQRIFNWTDVLHNKMEYFCIKVASVSATMIEEEKYS